MLRNYLPKAKLLTLISYKKGMRMSVFIFFHIRANLNDYLSTNHKQPKVFWPSPSSTRSWYPSLLVSSDVIFVEIIGTSVTWNATWSRNACNLSNTSLHSSHSHSSLTSSSWFRILFNGPMVLESFCNLAPSFDTLSFGTKVKDWLVEVDWSAKKLFQFK